jgi:hypothetical protein
VAPKPPFDVPRNVTAPAAVPPLTPDTIAWQAVPLTVNTTGSGLASR